MYKTILDKYKYLLEMSIINAYSEDRLKTRYYTFNIVMDHIDKNGSGVIIELGTTRSFMDGKYKGCNKSDEKLYWKPNEYKYWDWGGGCFTRVISEGLHYLGNKKLKIYSVDIVKEYLHSI